MRIINQLETLSDKELYEILSRRDDELIKHLTLDTDCDRDWENLPNDVKVMFFKRVCGEAYEVNGSGLKWLETNRCNPQVPYDVYLARHDLYMRLELLISDYAASLLRTPALHIMSNQHQVNRNLVSEAKREIAMSNRHGVIDYLLAPFLAAKRWLRTFAKFSFIVLIADPEFQREMAYLLRQSWLGAIVMFLTTRLWMYSHFLQELLVPLFMVLCLLRFKLISTIIVHTSRNWRFT